MHKVTKSGNFEAKVRIKMIYSTTFYEMVNMLEYSSFYTLRYFISIYSYYIRVRGKQ